MENFIFNSEVILNEDQYIFTLSINEDINMFDRIESVLENINMNIINDNIDNNIDNNYIIFNIEFEPNELYEIKEDNPKKFKNCNEINSILCKPVKIKNNNNILNEYCFICMEKYKLSEYQRELPNCKHYYHKRCIDKWLKKKATCPVCRNELL
jgi:hypothetical protein